MAQGLESAQGRRHWRTDLRGIYGVVALQHAYGRCCGGGVRMSMHLRSINFNNCSSKMHSDPTMLSLLSSLGFKAPLYRLGNRR